MNLEYYTPGGRKNNPCVETTTMNDFQRFTEMLLGAKQDFRVRYCKGEVIPVWEIQLDGSERQAMCCFTFTVDGKLVDTAVI